MKKLFSIITMAVLFACFCNQGVQAQEMNMIDEKTYYEIEEGSDGDGLSLIVTMDGLHKTAEIDGSTSGSVLPRYLGKYKDCLVFVFENGRANRDVITFRPIDGTLWQSTFDNELCSNSGETETCLFFYGDTPVKVDYNKKGSPRTKFAKLGSKYAKFKGHAVTSCGDDFSFVEE